MKLAVHVPVIALAATAGIVAAAQTLVSTPEQSVAGGFERALASAEPRQPTAAIADGRALDPRYLRLSSAPQTEAMPFGLERPLAVGDRLTIAGRDGESREFEVTDVHPLAPLASAGSGSGVLLLVTCSAHGPAGGDTTVRFIVESGAPAGRAELHRAL